MTRTSIDFGYSAFDVALCQRVIATVSITMNEDDSGLWNEPEGCPYLFGYPFPRRLWQHTEIRSGAFDFARTGTRAEFF